MAFAEWISTDNNIWDYDPNDDALWYPESSSSSSSRSSSSSSRSSSSCPDLTIIEDITIRSNLFVLDTTSTSTIIEPNYITSFTVKFIPEEVGTIVSPCVIINNDPDESLFSFDVIGIGVEE